MTANSPEPGRPAGPLLGRIRPLSALGRGHADRFGAKAATLGHLLARGFTVPDGFAIPADAFGMGADGPINAALADAICIAYRRLGEGSVAVRSSAFDEDGPQASAAGIYESVLGVGDEAALIAAVRHCLASGAAAPALAYRAAQGRGTAAGSMGVLVQRMVLADCAGVAYTVDPITARRDRLCLNATRGLGEALAAGRVSGETQVTDRAGTLIRGDRLPGAIPVLTPGQARALAALADRLEAELGGPLDLEFAFVGTTLYCLQARPVAAAGLAESQDARRAQVYLAAERVRLQERLRGLRTRGVIGAGEAALSNGNIAELLPNASPISLDLFQAVFTAQGGAIARGRRALGYRVPDDGALALLETFCGQPYFNLEVDARTFDSGYPLDLAGYLAAVRADPSRANYPEFGLYEQAPTLAEAQRRHGPAAGRRRYDESLAFGHRLRAKAETLLTNWQGGTRDRLEEAAAQARAIDWEGLGLEQVLGRLAERVRYLKDQACVDFVIAARLGFFFAERLRVALGALDLEDPQALHGRLLLGLDGSRITDLSLDLERLGRGELTLSEWLHVYGHLAPNELELTSPRYAEMPETIARLGQRIAAMDPRPSRRQAEQRADYGAAQRQLARGLGRLPGDEAATLASDLHLARAFLPLRETIKFHYTAEHAAIRRGLLRLAQLRDLAPELVFHLHLEELNRPPDLALLESRRTERRLGRRLLREGRLPAVIQEGAIQTLGAAGRQAPGRQLRGRAMAPGCSVGRVRVLDLDLDDPESLLVHLTGNEVLVTRSANLGLASLLRIAAGLVVEVGGILAHAACQARESGIPAVVLDNATSLLKDGMTVRLDGARGRVSIVAY
ncbi:PEP/pyruvate-binding domain-containing protein [uncultured Thiodictyon sp.]|jgi:pyruvate,water dikinase|uniref:PEP/pyruvate-binding domain-containing protein n=1 Tax=uncultured Thiodictyon sp. TaxID=1846217 RepID=UPI00260143CD|nr:PEP/pyruvate-binding domain-containing protein [uncultured Thiodictyon sp.]